MMIKDRFYKWKKNKRKDNAKEKKVIGKSRQETKNKNYENYHNINNKNIFIFNKINFFQS